ncbi:VanZ family protein [uncultured Eubacterium sp.]|uniref:VanZ family protein n=1 Tax=uncultured Eubacterium sp. TaxID=165185 RepID=UPI0026734562|nr:VanZ family protein [uncultured Eubacterium sp.]
MSYNKIRKYVIILFVIYMILLFMVLILKFPTGMISESVQAWIGGGEIIRLKPQFVPFGTIIPYIEQAHELSDWFVKNLACNIIMFMPYGFLYPIVTRKQDCLLIRTVCSACLLSAGIEITQYITAFGCCDIDDVILNTLGAVIGFGIYRAVYKKIINFIVFQKREKN